MPSPFRWGPGIIDESGAHAPGSPLNLGPGGPMTDAGPSTIRLTDPSRYGRRPSIMGGGPMGGMQLPGGPMGSAQLPPPYNENAMSSGGAALPAALPSGNAGGMFAGAAPKDHKGLFHGMDWKTIVGMIANGLLGYEASRGVPGAQAILENNMLMQRQKADDERKQRLPQQVGNSLVQLNPGSGQYESLYHAPEPFEAYAAARNLTPGTPEFADAVEQYRLGAWSDPAVAAKTDLAGYRFDRQDQMIDHRYDRSDQQLGQRLATTERGQNLTHADRRAGILQSDTNNRRSTGQSNTNNLRSTQTSVANNAATNATRLQTARHGRGGASSNEPTATDAHGRKIVVRNGRWVDAQTGHPVQ